MKIIGISDIHGNLINIPKCDVLCIAGDIINLNDQKNFLKSEHWWKTRFLTWAMKQPCNKILVTPGNHDFYLEHLYKENKWIEFCDYMTATTNDKLHFLIDQSYKYKGLHFYSNPWIQPITFQIGKWAFESTDLENQYKNIPICDILITHDSPLKNEYLYNDTLFKSNYHLYGHWHDGESNKKLGYFNCSRLDDCYNFKKNFKFIEINMKTKYELLQEFAEKVKDSLEPLLNTITGPERDEFLAKIDETLIQFLDNPKDTEDKIPWNESSMIDDFGTDEPDIDNEYK